MVDAKQPVTEQQVKDYLAEHPDFFVTAPDALEGLELNDSPRGTVSLAHKQIQRYQQKNAELAKQLAVLIENGRQNSQLQQTIHQICLHLIEQSSLHDCLQKLVSECQQNLQADEVAIRLFDGEQYKIALLETDLNISLIERDSEQIKAFDNIIAKCQPVCGRLNRQQKQILFQQALEQVQSVACLPLGEDPCYGLVAIASYDESRFHTDMATDYLAFLAEVLLRLIRLKAS